MPGQLEGKVAVISGAARGQGRSHAVRLAEEGADIIAMDICRQISTVPYPMATPDDLELTVKMVEHLGRTIVATHTDVRDGAAVTDAVDAGIAELGRIDIVVANAGITSFVPAHEVTEQTWQDTIGTNLTGVWHVCRAAMPHLIAGKHGGAMVLTGSTSAQIGLPNLSHYTAAKGGVAALTRSLAVELGPHMIRVNCVHPTTVNTPMACNQVTYDLFVPGIGGSGTEGTPEAVEEVFKTLNALPIPWVEPVDISNAVLFLVADSGRYITGASISVDAGSVIK
jgi:SDR family mycofactocin-dependent oxidoreductase